MEQRQRLFVCVLLALCATRTANGGNILVWYTEGSHWINMKPVLEGLLDRGHQVTVLAPSMSLFMNTSISSRFQYENFEVSISRKEMETFFDSFVHFTLYEMDQMNSLQIYMKFIEIMAVNMQHSLRYLDGVLKSDTVMKKLKEGKYDLLLADPVYPGSDLTAEILGIPLVLSLRFSFVNNWERYCGQLPAPPSYVPAAMSKLTDKMDFSERVWNLAFYLINDILLNNVYWKTVDAYYSEIQGKPTSACQTMSKADFWLIRTYWDFEFPRPFLPNFKYVGGIHCRPAKPLPEDMEEFVQSSGDAGIVVFTLGSIIKNITVERATLIASALAQIPQKVLWRYSGEKPETLGENTRTYDWIPQNDLLGISILAGEYLLKKKKERRLEPTPADIGKRKRPGHQKTRAFITHGGTNGIYEAIYHGVPMVGIPLFADQPDNLAHMKAKGAAVTVELNFMTTEDLRDAINTVITEKSYKESVMRLSSIHHDRPVSPLDEALFWIEFTMRNNGAQHLRVQAHELTWYQYHCLDVLAFFLAVILLITLLFIGTCRFCFRKCCGRKGKKKTE